MEFHYKFEVINN